MISYSRSSQQKKHGLRIIFLGHKYSGKTSTRNTVLGIGESHHGEEATHFTKRGGMVDGRKVTLTDTPGWWKVYSATQTAEYFKRELVLSVSVFPSGTPCLHPAGRAGQWVHWGRTDIFDGTLWEPWVQTSRNIPLSCQKGGFADGQDHRRTHQEWGGNPWLADEKVLKQISCLWQQDQVWW